MAKISLDFLDMRRPWGSELKVYLRSRIIGWAGLAPLPQNIKSPNKDNSMFSCQLPPKGCCRPYGLWAFVHEHEEAFYVFTSSYTSPLKLYFHERKMTQLSIARLWQAKYNLLWWHYPLIRLKTQGHCKIKRNGQPRNMMDGLLPLPC